MQRLSTKEAKPVKERDKCMAQLSDVSKQEQDIEFYAGFLAEPCPYHRLSAMLHVC